MDLMYIILYAICTFFALAHGDMAQTKLDKFSLTLDKMKTVNAENCWSKLRVDLELPMDAAAKSLQYDGRSISYSNNSVLLHLHNTALYRALYYSLIYQKLNQSKDFQYQPNLIHFYMSAMADVSANRGWNKGSALWFDKNSIYPNWLRELRFNQTLSLFGVRAWNAGNTFDTKWAREPITGPTDDQVFIDSRFLDYTDPVFKFCPYTSYNYMSPLWWPDDRGYVDSLKKSVYRVGVKFSNATALFKTTNFEDIWFFGPTPLDMPVERWREREFLPVLMTMPYFDCGRSNRWVVSMTSPVTEYMPRYSPYTYLRRPRFVALVGMEVGFEDLDINPCPLSEDNPPPNLFAGIARCRNTTVCEPVKGFGFRRGGYQCVCKAGLYYPWQHEGPFQGVDIEESTEEEYNSGSFDCVTVDELQHFSGNASAFVGMASELETFENETWLTAQSIFDQMSKVTRANCLLTVSSQLHMTEDVIYGASEQLEAQGRTALRIAHYLSNFLQNAETLHGILSSTSEFTNPFRHGLNEDQIFGDIIAAMLADSKLAGVGVFFDKNKFDTDHGTTKEFFGPFAYRQSVEGEETEKVQAVDYAGFSSQYIKQEWFREMKEHSVSKLESLPSFRDSPSYLSDTEITYRGPLYGDGKWSQPTFKCDGIVMDWVISYRVPFYGPESSGSGLEFKGVVTVDVKLVELDINQCPADDSDVNNAFGNTAKCHVETQRCVPVPGKGFMLGSYRCICRHGYESPFPSVMWIDGETMEEEFENKMNGNPNRYDTLECKEIAVIPPSTTGKTRSFGAVVTTDKTSSGILIRASFQLITIAAFLSCLLHYTYLQQAYKYAQ